MAVDAPRWEELGEAEEYAALVRQRLEHVVPVTEPLVLCSQIQRSGGTLLSQLFDGHPECHAHPHEIKIGWPREANWPPLDLDRPDEWFERLFERKALKHFLEGYESAAPKPEGGAPPSYDVFPFLFLPRLPEGDLRRARRGRDERARRARRLLHLLLQRLARRPEPLRGAEAGRDRVHAAAGDRPGEPRPVLRRLPRRDAASRSSASPSPGTARRPGTASGRFPDVETALGLWRESTEAALDERVVLVTYERLVGKTEEVMARLAGRIGITLLPVLLEPTFNSRPIRANSAEEVARYGILASRKPAAAGPEGRRARGRPVRARRNGFRIDPRYDPSVRSGQPLRILFVMEHPGVGSLMPALRLLHQRGHKLDARLRVAEVGRVSPRASGPGRRLPRDRVHAAARDGALRLGGPRRVAPAEHRLPALPRAPLPGARRGSAPARRARRRARPGRWREGRRSFGAARDRGAEAHVPGARAVPGAAEPHPGLPRRAAPGRPPARAPAPDRDDARRLPPRREAPGDPQRVSGARLGQPDEQGPAPRCARRRARLERPAGEGGARAARHPRGEPPPDRRAALRPVVRAQPSRSREEFCRDVGLRADRPIVLYVCSSRLRRAGTRSTSCRSWIERAARTRRRVRGGRLPRPSASAERRRSGRTSTSARARGSGRGSARRRTTRPRATTTSTRSTTRTRSSGSTPPRRSRARSSAGRCTRSSPTSSGRPSRGRSTSTT